MISCNDDDYPYIEIPSVVINGFRAEYPSATDVEFEKAEGGYEAEFEIDDKDVEIFLDSTGIVLRKKKEVKWENLPTEVRKTIEEKFGAGKVKEPEIIKYGSKTYYQIKIKNWLSDEKVILNKSGILDGSLDYWD